MKGIIKIFTFSLVFAIMFCALSYAESPNIQTLVDNFQKSTDLQRSQILKDILGKEISSSGLVSNAGEYDFFDIVDDIKGTYYQVSTDQQKTKNNIPYQIIYLFKDKDKVKDLDKGTNIQKDGKIVRIEDERLQIAVWILCADLTEKDKALIK
ncbi:MAG: hypothetical protein PHO70_06085 [Candidatus Omnitrophica bacterium]|nr:hypothetical protein [Candidatus Omnitrophota bacterium]